MNPEQEQLVIDAVLGAAAEIEWHDGAIIAEVVEPYSSQILVGETVDEVAAKRAARDIAARYPFLVRPPLEERIAELLGPDVPPASGRPVGSGPKRYGRPRRDDGALKRKYPALGA